MKKIFSLVLSLGICCLSGMALAACDFLATDSSSSSDVGHEHTFETVWSKDETHHWYACKGTDCEGVSDKEEHTFEENVCTVCSYEKQAVNPTPSIYEVTAEQFNAALSFNDVASITVECETLDGEIVSNAEWYIDGNKVKQVVDGETSYYEKISNDIFMYFYANDTTELAYVGWVKMGFDFPEAVMFIGDYAQMFNAISFDECVYTENIYTYSKIFNEGTNEETTVEFQFQFENATLTSVRMSNGGTNYDEFHFTAYNETTVVLPTKYKDISEITPVPSSEWESYFDFGNVTVATSYARTWSSPMELNVTEYSTMKVDGTEWSWTGDGYSYDALYFDGTNTYIDGVLSEGEYNVYDYIQNLGGVEVFALFENSFIETADGVYYAEEIAAISPDGLSPLRNITLVIVNGKMQSATYAYNYSITSPEYTETYTAVVEHTFSRWGTTVVDELTEPPHVCSFMEVVDDAYLLTSATCEKAAVYYKSCLCGETGEEIFTFGTPIAHNYVNGFCSMCEKADPTEYSIIYNTNGGSHDNPGKYTVLDEITLLDAERVGYVFQGWFDLERNKVTEIELHSIGDIELTAKWECINYTISYENIKGCENNNPITYTIEDDIVFLDLEHSDYAFIGWTYEGAEIVSLPIGTTGDLTIEAKWISNLNEITCSDVLFIKEADVITPGLFNASCFNTDGESIDIELSVEGALVAGEIITIKMVADNGYQTKEKVLHDIKVYGNPVISLKNDEKLKTIYQDTIISDLFVAVDSFSVPLFFEYSMSSSSFVVGERIVITVSATDIAGNITTVDFDFYVISEECPLVDLYVNDTYWKSEVVLEGAISIPDTEKNGYYFYGWRGTDNILYTDETGTLQQSIDGYMKLEAVFALNGYTPVSTIGDLTQMTMDGNYCLVNDIDLLNMEWEPIGTNYKPFKGVFEGNGYTISNFKLTTDRMHGGLFGYNQGTIKNLGVEGYEINFGYWLKNTYGGGIAGYNIGSIINCFADGSLTVRNSVTGMVTAKNSFAGSITGLNGGSVVNCYSSSGNVSAISIEAAAYAGGLVGENSGVLLNSYVFNDVISRSVYSTGFAGGLCGRNTGVINNCYSSNNLVEGLCTSREFPGSAYAGGFVSQNEGIIKNSFTTTNNVKAEAISVRIGGFVAYLDEGIVENSYRSSSQNVEPKGIDGNLSCNTCYSGFVKDSNELLSKDWLIKNLWIVEGDIWDFTKGYPSLDYDFINNTVILIQNADDLLKLKGAILTLNYELTNDIDIGNNEWVPIDIFVGKLDGKGYKISNMKITSRNFEFYGLIGRNFGCIENVTLNEINITINNPKNASIGGLVGVNNTPASRIFACTTSGEITITTNVTYTNYKFYLGGMVAENSGKMSQCSSSVKMTAQSTVEDHHSEYMGGLVGFNYGLGSIINCYSTGDIDSGLGGYVGGLSGYCLFALTPDSTAVTDSGLIMNSYATGNITVKTHKGGISAGGLVGYHQGTVKNCFATGNVTVEGGKNSVLGSIAGTAKNQIKNCYVVDTQIFKLTIDDTTTNEAATVKGVEKRANTYLQDESFVTTTLTWSKDIWNFAEGQYPTLIN